MKMIEISESMLIRIHGALISACENAKYLRDYHEGDRALVALYSKELDEIEKVRYAMEAPQ